MQTNKYTVVENVLSERSLKLLEPYLQLLPDDKNTKDTWAEMYEVHAGAADAYTQQVLGTDRLTIIEELFNNPKLPCYKKRWLLNAEVDVHKLPDTAFVPKHKDYCMFSLTLFLCKDKDFVGGNFVWWDDDNNVIIVEPEYNKGIIACYDDFRDGADHEVSPVSGGVRYSMQLFVFNGKIK